MQSLSRQRASNNSNNQSPTIAFIAIFLFALAGLISGFSVGAFVHPTSSRPGNSIGTITPPPSTNQSQTATRTPPSQHPLKIDEPVIDQYQYTEFANSSTSYTFSAHATHNGQPVHSSAITCKIWITRDGDVNKHITQDRLGAVDTLNQPFPGETQNALTFDATTPQTLLCNNGQGTWKYTLASSTDPGLYYMVILMDWSGVHFNWKWVAIVIKQ